MSINVKWGIYAGVAALLLALVISLIIGQASFSVAFLRGLCFAALFFILGTGAWVLINTFMPELLFPETSDAAVNVFGSGSDDSQNSDSQIYGSRINITLGDRSDTALPDNDGSDEVGNIADLVSGAIDPAAEAKKNKGLDELNENSYTEPGEGIVPSMTDFAEPLPTEDSGGFSMSFDNFALDGAVTGLEPFGDSFSLPGDMGGAGKDEDLPERKVTGNKPVALEGDFNPKDIAAGIRTVLETDKRG